MNCFMARMGNSGETTHLLIFLLFWLLSSCTLVLFHLGGYVMAMPCPSLLPWSFCGRSFALDTPWPFSNSVPYVMVMPQHFLCLYPAHWFRHGNSSNCFLGPRYPAAFSLSYPGKFSF